MGRQRLSGPEAVKVSFLLPHQLNRQVEDLVARRKWDKSHVLRHLIALGLDAERRQEGSPAIAPSESDRGAGQEGQGLMIGLTDELRACIDLAAGLHGVDSKTLVQMIIGETVATYIERGKQRREELRRLVEEGRQGL